MAIFTGTAGADTLNASSGTIVGFSGGTLAELQDAIGDTISGGIGNDSVAAGSGHDFVVGGLAVVSSNTTDTVFDRPALTANGSVATALAVPPLWNSAANANIGGAPTVEHLTVRGAGDAGQGIRHFYKVSAIAGQTLLFDLDAVAGLSVDTVLRLYDAAGNVVQLNDDANSFMGGSGSTSSANSFLSYTARQSGDVVIEVGRAGGGASLAAPAGALNALDDGTNGISYDLNIAVVTQAAGSGNDQLLGGVGSDTLLGGDGADTLVGGAGADVVHGGDGDDVIIVSTASEAHPHDQIDGGSGIDELRLGALTLAPSQYVTSIEILRFTGAAAASIDSYQFGDGRIDPAVTLEGGAAGVAPLSIIMATGGQTSFSAASFIYGAGFVGGAIAITGTTSNDAITGSSRADALYGLDGDDTLTGGSGNDTLSGGEGFDVLIGGAGADQLDAGPDALGAASYEGASAGVEASLVAPATNAGDAAGDTYVDISALIGSAWDDRLAAGTTGLTISGGNGNDTLEGGSGVDFIYGDAGNDTLSSGGNGDVLYVGTGSDAVNGGAGGDAIYLADGIANDYDTIDGGADRDLLDMSAFTNGVFLDLEYNPSGNNLFTPTGFGRVRGIESFIATAFNDVLRGNSDSNQIVGGDGNDQILGYSPYDPIFGLASLGDVMEGGAGNDTMFSGTGNDYMDGGSGDDQIEVGGGTDRVITGLGNDTIFISPRSGDDTIVDFTGGVGAGDVLRLYNFGAAFDTFAEVYAASSQVGAHTHIVLTDTRIILENFTRTTLVADDFQFV